MNGYELTRRYFNWAFVNPDLATPMTASVYFFILDLWNRNGGELKPKFSFSKQPCKEALGVSDIRTLNAGFNALVEHGFIQVHREAKNQNTSWIISVAHTKNATADATALDIANSIATTTADATAPSTAITPVLKQLNNRTIEHIGEIKNETEEINQSPSPKSKTPFSPPTETECIEIMRRANKDGYITEDRVKIEAEAFYLYWNEKKWKDVTDVNGRARRWILNIKKREPKIVQLDQPGIYKRLKSQK